MVKRVLSPYEKNFLKRQGTDLNIPIDTDIPVEYLVGKAEFKKHLFFVDNNTLIPRIETESLVDIAVDNLNKNFQNQKKIIILDMCTGTGCIGISIALELVKQNMDFEIYFVDISEPALNICKKNINLFLKDQKNKTHIVLSNLFQNLPRINFDLIVSNPPYIPTKNIPNLSNSVKNYEPLLALDGGEDGTTIINKIINNLPKFQKKVNAFIEIDDTHNLKKIKSEGLNPSLIKDQFNVDRFIFFSS